MTKSVLSTIAVVGVLCTLSGCAPSRIGGMTLHDAFPDKRVAQLIEAALRGDYTEADQQLKAGADVNTIGTDGISPLIWVITTRNWKATEYLLKAGADPNYRDKTHEGSAMYLAAGGNSPELLELLLKYKGDPNLTRQGGSLLRVAIMQGRRANIELLLKYGADLNYHGLSNETVASTAAGLGRFDLVYYFLERGLSYNLQDLAKDVEIVQVPPNSEAQRWKDKVIELLKARGVKFPAFVPKGRKGL